MTEDERLLKTRQQLQAELDSLSEQLQAIETQLDDRPDFGLGQGDPGAANWEMTLARRQRLEAKMEAHTEALDRIDQGSYGVCKSCGARIDPERLAIVPTTVLCAECAGAESKEAA